MEPSGWMYKSLVTTGFLDVGTVDKEWWHGHRESRQVAASLLEAAAAASNRTAYARDGIVDTESTGCR
jgi:hypothetical protein